MSDSMSVTSQSTPTGFSEAEPESALDPDIPRLTLSIDTELSLSSPPLPPMQIAEHDNEYDDVDEDDERESNGGNEQDDEDDDDGCQTDRAEDFKRPDADDVEASFIKYAKPPCSKTTLVSCLSSRPTSPGAISPLASDDDYPSLSCGSSFSSRRSSNDCCTPRVRFKRGCVITQVNLTWAAASYDRAPIDVAESLDMKRCQSIEDSLDPSEAEASADLDSAIADSDDDDQKRGRWLCAEENDGDSTPLGSQVVAPPSPPLQSSPCTAAQANYAYSSTFGEMFGLEGLDSLSIPSLSPDESSMGSGSDSDECHWNLYRQCSSPSTSVGHPSAFSKATAQSSLGAAAAELSQQCREEEQQRGRSLSADTSCAYPSSSSSSASIPHSSRPSYSRRGSEHEVSPPPAGEQPARKAPRYGLCAMGKFSRNEVFDACDALGGF